MSAATSETRVIGTDRPDGRQVHPLEPLSWALGGAFVVWSLVALVRIGFDTPDLFLATSVAGIGVSRLLALVVIVLGAALWAAVSRPVLRLDIARTTGALLTVGGLVLAIEPDALTPYLGAGTLGGIVATAIGVVVLLTSLAPTFRMPG